MNYIVRIAKDNNNAKWYHKKIENILRIMMDVDNGKLIKNTNKYIALF
jgi:hypothetical protein